MIGLWLPGESFGVATASKCALVGAPGLIFAYEAQRTLEVIGKEWEVASGKIKTFAESA